MKILRLTLALLPVVLVAGAVPAFSSSTAPHATTRQGVTLVRDTRSSTSWALTTPWQTPLAAPLRVPDPASYAAKKAQAERGYQRWLRTHPSSATTAAPSRLTSVSGTLNKPGVDSSDPANQGTPPDTTGAIGPSNYVEMVNSELAVYSNTDLTTPTATLDEGTFTGGDQSPCDGQIQWDQQGQRWLYAILGNCAEDFNQPNNLYFGWSKTTSPDLSASNWCQYTIPTGQNLEDYPKLGHDDTQILIGTNEFGNSFTSNIYVFDKPADPTTCPNTNTEGGSAAVISINSNFVGGYTPVPANIADSSAAGYVTAIDFDQAHLDLYKVGRDISNNNVLLSTTSVTVPAFCFPAYVPQPGTTDTLDTLDTRLTQSVAVTDPNTSHEGIWTQHTISQGCSNGNSSGPAVVRWYELSPGATTPTQMGTVHGPNGAFAFMGAISPSSDGNNAAIFYNSGSSTQLADFRVQDRHLHTTSGQMIEDLQLAASPYADEDASCDPNPQDGIPCRWGDYNGASPDPSNPNLVWGTGNLTTFPVNTNPLNPFPLQWGTENAAIDVTPAANYGLTVTPAGGGAGTVTTGDLSINCPGTCSNSYAYGATQTLTETPGAHSFFAGWSGDCSGTGTTCQVPMGGPQNVTATFSLIPESLSFTKSGNGAGTVSSSPSGLNCSSSCSHNFDYGTGVQLTATGATGSTFAGWSGACSGTGTCNVTMNQAQSVTATFTLVPETLTVSKAGAGSGTVASTVTGIDCGSTCSHAFDYGTNVTLTAVGSTGSVFTGWSGACSGTGNCVVPMTGAKAVTATFGLAPETLTVNKSGTGSGKVVSSDGSISCASTCSHDFDYGTSVTLTARPAPSAKFVGWSGACSGTGNCTVSMTGAAFVTAKFTKLSCVVPDVTGKKLAAAKTAIDNANCAVGTITKQKSSTVKKGKVISQSPAAGKKKAYGTKVSLVVSKGK